MNEKLEKYKTFRTLLWVLELSDDFNLLLLVLLYWLGYHNAFALLMILYIAGAFLPGTRWKLMSELKKELFQCE